MSDSCQDCSYARQERAGMLMGEGVALALADEQALMEKCAKHRNAERGTGNAEQGTLRVVVVQWMKDAKQDGEFVGWPRTLAGPYRFGFDGSREEVIRKYERWLFAEVKMKGRGWVKLIELMKEARQPEGLTLVCMEPEFGKVIGRCLQWMADERKDVA